MTKTRDLADLGGGFIQVGATVDMQRTVESKLQDVVSVKDFGAAGNGTDEDTDAIQAAIDSLGSAGGVIYFPAGTYLSGQIILKDRVILEGASIQSTTLKAKNNLNDHFIKSFGFDGLTGQNKWLNSDGVLAYIGLRNLQVDGNKANQTSGDGLRLYCKALRLDEIVIRDCKGNGIYSEAGDIAGQTGWQDLPEGNIGKVWIRNCDGHGWHFRGPHDSHISQIVCNENGLDGFRSERSAGVYSGVCDIGLAHIYANDGYGFYCNTNGTYESMISESNYQEGVYFDGSFLYQGGMTQLYKNLRSTGSYQFYLNGSHCTFNNVVIKNFNAAADGGMDVVGDYNTINNLVVYGNTGVSAGTGLVTRAGANGNVISGTIRFFDAAGGTALKTNDGGDAQYNQYKLALSNSATLWNNAAVSKGSKYSLTGFCGAGQTAFTGSGPNTLDGLETWDVYFNENGTDKLSTVRKKSGSSFALDGAAGTSSIVTIAHGLLAAPEVEDVNVTLYFTDSGGGTSYGAARVSANVQSVDATDVIVKVVIGSPGAAGSLGYVLINAQL